jgi:hypothetical protein
MDDLFISSVELLLLFMLTYEVEMALLEIRVQLI